MSEVTAASVHRSVLLSIAACVCVSALCVRARCCVLSGVPAYAVRGSSLHARSCLVSSLLSHRSETSQHGWRAQGELPATWPSEVAVGTCWNKGHAGAGGMAVRRSCFVTAVYWRKEVRRVGYRGSEESSSPWSGYATSALVMERTVV